MLIDGRPCQVYTCNRCERVVRRYQDSKDTSSTSNLNRHVKTCLRDNAVGAVVRPPFTDRVRTNLELR